MFTRNKTPPEYISIGVCICTILVYLSGEPLNGYLVLSNVIMSQSGTGFRGIIPERFPPQTKKRISEFIIDETMLKAGSEYIWLWMVALEPENRQILALFLPKNIHEERNMFVAVERFIDGLVRVYGGHPVSTDMVIEPGSQPDGL